MTPFNCECICHDPPCDCCNQPRQGHDTCAGGPVNPKEIEYKQICENCKDNPVWARD